jgi:hypothetical protein
VLAVDGRAESKVEFAVQGAVEPAEDVVGAKVGQVRFDAADVALELLLDGHTDGFPTLLGLLERGAGQSDGALVGSSLTAAEAVGVGTRLGSSEHLPGGDEFVGGVTFGGEAPPAGPGSEQAKVVLESRELQLSIVALHRKVGGGGDGAEAVEPSPHPGDAVL